MKFYLRHFTIALAATFLVSCGATVQTKQAPTAQAPKQCKAAAPASLKTLLPPAPKTFDAATEIQLRNRDTIFEQINGGSVSYLENGMTKAIFATYLRGAHDGQELTFEIYRFKTPKGAKSQFAILAGKDGKPWDNGSTAVVHDYGIELVSKTLIVRVAYNDGPPKIMTAASAQLARHVLNRH